MTVQNWLDARASVMPDALRLAVDAALEAVAVPTDPQEGELAAETAAYAMADAGLAALRRVVRGGPDRTMATELLAADALLTYACEAAVEGGPEAVARVTGRLGTARFGALLEGGTE